MENIEQKLMQSITTMSELELQELEIRFAKFNLELKESYESKIKSIESNIDSQIVFFGKSVDDCYSEKKSILDKYSEEFQKVYDLRKEQFFNIQAEIQEMQANQKIALLNFKKIIDEKNNFMNSQDFIDYMNKKQEFKNIVETTLKHDEFDKYTKLLEELKDPVEAYDKKLVALVNKFDGYKALIEECERKLEECKSAGKSDFDEIVRFRNNSLSVKKSNPIMSFVSKILNILTGNKKFEKEVILKMQKELKDVEESNNTNISAISDQTILLVSKIQEVRNALNKEFKIATE